MNLILTSFLLFGFKLGAGALGLSNTISSSLNVALLAFALRKKLKTLALTEFLKQLPAVAGAGVAAAAVAWLAFNFWDQRLGHTQLFVRLGAVFVPAILASVVYFSITLWCKVSAAGELVGLVSRKVKPEAPAK